MSQEAASERFEDLPVTVEVRIGSRNMAVEDVLRLEPGSVLVLDRNAGEMLDVLVGGVFLANGEAVVVEDRLAVRISDFDSDRTARG
jgi:flagellar motor switch protein FliN/FliY